MAKGKTINVDAITENWVTVDKTDAPAFNAWREFRSLYLGAGFVPGSYFVPSRMPPDDQRGIQAYIDDVNAIRASQGIGPVNAKITIPAKWVA